MYRGVDEFAAVAVEIPSLFRHQEFERQMKDVVVVRTMNSESSDYKRNGGFHCHCCIDQIDDTGQTDANSDCRSAQMSVHKTHDAVRKVVCRQRVSVAHLLAVRE